MPSSGKHRAQKSKTKRGGTKGPEDRQEQSEGSCKGGGPGIITHYTKHYCDRTEKQAHAQRKTDTHIHTQLTMPEQDPYPTYTLPPIVWKVKQVQAWTARVRNGTAQSQHQDTKSKHTEEQRQCLTHGESTTRTHRHLSHKKLRDTVNTKETTPQREISSYSSSHTDRSNSGI